MPDITSRFDKHDGHIYTCTTPTFKFITGFNKEDISKIEIVMKNFGDTNYIIKNKNDCVLEPNSISVSLTQEETLALNKSDVIEIQMRIATVSNPPKVFATDIFHVSVDEILKEGVMT